MPAIGQQRHRSEHCSSGDLTDHHRYRQRDHKPGAALVAVVALAEEDVIVGPLIEGM
jgi:hypothetical protein